jgi:hypothetical protein
MSTADATSDKPSEHRRRPWVLVGVLLALFGVMGFGTLRSIQMAQEAARRTKARGHMKQLGLALHNFHDGYGHFPPQPLADGDMPQSWMTDLLPYMNQQALHNGIVRTAAWNDPANKASFRVVVPQYQNPSLSDQQFDATGYALAHFAGNSRIFAGERRTRIADIRDGTSNTFLAGMVGAGFKPWADPSNHRDPSRGVTGGPQAFGSPHPTAVYLLMADGSIRNAPRTIDPRVFELLGDPSDGERIPDEAFAVK